MEPSLQHLLAKTKVLQGLAVSPASLPDKRVLCRRQRSIYGGLRDLPPANACRGNPKAGVRRSDAALVPYTGVGKDIRALRMSEHKQRKVGEEETTGPFAANPMLLQLQL